MNEKERAIRLKEWALKAGLGLDSDNITIQYIWNPGGFVNRSYQISDREKCFHVKFCKKDHIARLKQWARIHEYLTENYRAPKMLMEIHEAVIPGHPYGLVFEFFEGDVWKGQAWQDEILLKISKLHGDPNLKRVLSRGGKTCAEALIQTYIHRFREDMKIIDADRESLPFVKEETFEMFHKMTDQLEKEVKQANLFQRPAEDVVHNDLNQQNILVNEDRFCMIDWDDLTIGDTAADYASLLWPWVYSKEWPVWEGKVRDLAGMEVVERMSLYFKAKLLDDVIDVLADYVEAEKFPEVKERTQQRAKATHLSALELYMARYETSLYE
ncbi:aminoglycoside phosphotransferase family protein [Halobacillus faecis]